MEDELKNIDYSDRTILVCDDEDAYRKFLNKILVKFLKARVLIAANPSEMFELLKTEKPNLIILDLQMPIMDGQTALKLLRESPETELTPVMICSALGFESVIINLAKLNISGFIIKPFEASTVLLKIHQVLKNQRK